MHEIYIALVHHTSMHGLTARTKAILEMLRSLE